IDPGGMVATSLRGVPSFLIYAKMQRRKLGEQSKHAVDRTKIAAPDALVAPVTQADEDRCAGRSSQHDEDGLGILIDAHHLAIDRDARKGPERPAAPGEPARQRASLAIAAGELGQRSFGTDQPAPGTPDQHHAQQDEWPPDAPEYELGEHRQ